MGLRTADVVHLASDSSLEEALAPFAGRPTVVPSRASVSADDTFDCGPAVFVAILGGAGSVLKGGEGTRGAVVPNPVVSLHCSPSWC